MGFPQPKRALGPPHGGDWDFADQVRAGAVGVGDVDRWGWVVDGALPGACLTGISAPQSARRRSLIVDIIGYDRILGSHEITST
jgi:hypothetical protein